MMKSNIEKQVEMFKRGLLLDLYNQCTPAQQDLFNRIWKGVDHVPEKELVSACELCERTITKNKQQ